jgi:mono/diheme cytochrome c family protein
MFGHSRKLAVTLFALAAPVGMLWSATAQAGAPAEDFDAAAYYASAKCSMCHTAKAEKHFDATKADDALAASILNGVKPEKPPFMPSYEAKGVTADQAKALVVYMKSLKS